MVEKDSQLSEHENLKKGLLNFIHSHETLIDYFAIIGFENAQLRRIIHELKVEVSTLHTLAFPRESLIYVNLGKAHKRW